MRNDRRLLGFRSSPRNRLEVYHLALALVLAGCGREPAHVDPCTRELDDLAARLERAASFADPSGAPVDIPLARAAGGMPLEGTPPLLVVGTGEIRLGGRDVGGIDEPSAPANLAADARALRDASELDEASPWTIALWADREVEVGRLIELLAPISADARFALLVRADDVRAPRPRRPVPWVREALRPRASESAADRRERLELAWDRATGSCEPARDHLPVPPELEMAGPPMGKPSVAPLIGALRRCGCDAFDLPAVEAITLGALVSPDGPLVRLPQELRFGRATDDARELAVDPNAEVGDLVETLARTRHSGELWIAPE